MITALCTSFRSLLLYREWIGKLLRQFSEEAEAFHIFLTNIDLYAASFKNCVKLRKATATNRREEGSTFSFARLPYGYRLGLRIERSGIRVRALSGVLTLRSWARLVTLKVHVPLYSINRQKIDTCKRTVKNVQHYIPLHVQVSTMWSPDGLQIDGAAEWMN